jgi:hypothetical protein
VAALLMGALATGCTSLDDDDAQLPERRASFLLLELGGQRRLDALIDTAYLVNWGQTRLGLSAVSHISLYDDWLVALDSANRRLALHELGSGQTTVLDLSSQPAPLSGLAAGPEYAALGTGARRLVYVSRAARALAGPTLPMPQRAQAIAYSQGRFYATGPDSLVVVEVAAFAVRDTGRFVPGFGAIGQLEPTNDNRLRAVGRLSGRLATAGVDQLSLIAEPPALVDGLQALLASPYARRQYGRERVLDVRLTPRGVPDPLLQEFTVAVGDSVTSVGFDFFDNAAFYVVSSPASTAERLVYDRLGLATGARVLLTAPGPVRVLATAHSWRIPD